MHLFLLLTPAPLGGSALANPSLVNMMVKIFKIMARMLNHESGGSVNEKGINIIGHH